MMTNIFSIINYNYLLVPLLVVIAASCNDAFTITTTKQLVASQKSSLRSPTSTTGGSRHQSTQLFGESALIIQNKGGGHGEIGYQLCKMMLENEKYANFDTITILQDEKCKKLEEPFQSYETDLLTSSKVNIIYGPIGDDIMMNAKSLKDMLNGQSYSYVWDNASKDNQGLGKAVIDLFSSTAVDGYRNTLRLLCYVSSAGMYNPSKDHGRNPLSEFGTPVKTNAGQNLYEQFAIQQGIPLVSFRPQYIYGPKSNKFDYIDYFFDRVVRHLPIPIPCDGNQLVSLTNAIDIASLLLAPVGHERAALSQRFFNCGTDSLISYRDLAYLCAEMAGIPKFNVKIEYFNPEELGTKGTFPFREKDFYVLPDQIKQVCGWEGPKNTLYNDLIWYFNDYKNNRNGLTKNISLIKDWEIVVGSKSSLPEYVASIYEQYDPLILRLS